MSMIENARLKKIVSILSEPKDSDEIWWAIGEIEAIIKGLEAHDEPN